MRAKLSETDRERLRDLYWEKELSIKEIAKIYGFGIETIRSYMEKLRVPRRSYGEVRKLLCGKGNGGARLLEKDKENLGYLYWKEKLTLRQIARTYNSISPETVRKYLEKWGIKRRSHGDHLLVHPKLSPSPILAYILGAMLGDGCISEEEHEFHYRIILSTRDFEFAKSFQDALEKIGIHSKIFKVTEHSFQARGWSKIFCKWYKSLKFEEITRMARQYPKDFVRGFHEAEGSCYEWKTIEIRMYNTNKELILLVRDLLNKMEFKTSIRCDQRKFRINPLYSICLKGRINDKLRFFREIQPCIKRPRNYLVS